MPRKLVTNELPTLEQMTIGTRSLENNYRKLRLVDTVISDGLITYLDATTKP